MSCHCLSSESSPPLKSFQGSFFDGCRLVFNMDSVRAPTKKRKAENQRKRETRGVRTCGKFRTRNQAKTKPRVRRMAERRSRVAFSVPVRRRRLSGFLFPEVYGKPPTGATHLRSPLQSGIDSCSFPSNSRPHPKNGRKTRAASRENPFSRLQSGA